MCRNHARASMHLEACALHALPGFVILVVGVISFECGSSRASWQWCWKSSATLCFDGLGR